MGSRGMRLFAREEFTSRRASHGFVAGKRRRRIALSQFAAALAAVERQFSC